MLNTAANRNGESVTVKLIRRNKTAAREQQENRERDEKKFLRSVCPLYYIWPLFSPHYENRVLNYGKRFTAKQQAANTEVNSSISQRVRMMLITITSSTSHKAITTLHLLRSAHWSPLFLS